MSTSLSNLVSNLSEGIHHYRGRDCKPCLDYMITKDEQLIFRCFRGKKIMKKTLIKIYFKDFQIHMNFAMEILTNLFCY